MRVAFLLCIALVVCVMPAAQAESLAQRVWKRYTRGSSVQVRAVSRFEDLSLEAKPSAYDNTDPAVWKQMESEIRKLAGQEIRTHIAVQQPNRLYLAQVSAFGSFHSVCDGKVWQMHRQDGASQRTPAPANLHQMTAAKYRAWLGLDESNDAEVLHLLVVRSSAIREKLVKAREEPGAKPHLKHLVWSEPIEYQGLKGEGIVTCVVDTRTALIQRVEYRYSVNYGTEARLNIVIGQQWDNTLLSEPPPPSLFRVEQGRGVRKR